MQELLKNAWQGWIGFAEQGKFAALLLMVLLFLWFRREKCKEQLLLVYTTIIVGCCIFPITAAVLMKYQTLFYDYEWIWSYVPLTIMIAYGIVVFWTELCGKQKKEASAGKRNRIYPAGLGIVIITIIFLCGRLGSIVEGAEPDRLQRQNTGKVLEALVQESEGQEICLWAPKEIMSAARGQNADVRLIYGRNMWEAALGAYSYEVYGKTEEILYLWMCNAEETGSIAYIAEDGSIIDGTWCIQAAKAAGVNRVLLPNNIVTEELHVLSNEIGQVVQQLEGYYLLEL